MEAQIPSLCFGHPTGAEAFHSTVMFLSLFPRFSPFGCRCALPFAYAHGTRGMHRIYAEIILVAVLPVGVVAVQVGKAFNS